MNEQKYNLNSFPKLIKLTFDPAKCIKDSLRNLSEKYLNGCHFEWSSTHIDNELILESNDYDRSFITRLTDNTDAEWMKVIQGKSCEYTVYIPSGVLLMEDFKTIKMNNNQKYNLDHNGMPLPTKLIKLTFDPAKGIKGNLNDNSKKYLDGCHFEYSYEDELRLYYNDSANSFITKLADRDDPEWMAILRGAKELEIYIPSSLLLLENGHKVLLTANFDIKEFAEAVNKFIVETFSKDKDLLEQYVNKGIFRDLPSHIHDESKEFCRYFKNNPELVERFKKHYSVQMLVVKLKNDEFEVFE